MNEVGSEIGSGSEISWKVGSGSEKNNFGSTTLLLTSQSWHVVPSAWPSQAAPSTTALFVTDELHRGSHNRTLQSCTNQKETYINRSWQGRRLDNGNLDGTSKPEWLEFSRPKLPGVCVLDRYTMYLLPLPDRWFVHAFTHLWWLGPDAIQ